MAEDSGRAAGEQIGHAMTWWVQTPSVNPDDTPVHVAQSYTLPIIGLLLMVGILVQAIRMVLTRKGTPAVEVFAGLLKYAAVSSIGLMVLGGAVAAGDGLSQWMLNSAIHEFSERLRNTLTIQDWNGKIGLLFVSAILWLLAAIQWVIGFLRQAGILVLAAMLPLAAAGSLMSATRQWLPKVGAAVSALVVYKPMAAFIYVIGLALMTPYKDSQQNTAMAGITVLVIAAFSLPTLMGGFFRWSGANFSGGGGAMGGMLGSFAGSSMGSGGGSSGASGAADRDSSVQTERRMEASGPGSAPDGADPSATTGGDGPDLPGAGGGATGSSEHAGQAGQAETTAEGSAASSGAQTTGASSAAGPQAAAVTAGAQALKQTGQKASSTMTGEQQDEQ